MYEVAREQCVVGICPRLLERNLGHIPTTRCKKLFLVLRLTSCEGIRLQSNPVICKKTSIGLRHHELHRSEDSWGPL